MQAVLSTRKYIYSAAISTFITSLCLMILIPRNIKRGFFFDNIDIIDCDTYNIIFYILKLISLIPLFLIVLYRIYFCSNWYIYNEYIYDDTCMKTMKIEVMIYQRGYRIVYYLIITILSSLLFFFSSYFEYNNIKHCLYENSSDINALFNKEKISAFIIGIILAVYLFESFYLRDLFFAIIKSWNHIDYDMGINNNIWKQIFFFRIKNNFNYIMKICYSIIFIGIILYYLCL